MKCTNDHLTCPVHAAWKTANKQEEATREALLSETGIDIYKVTPGSDTDCETQRRAVAARTKAARLAAQCWCHE